MKEYILSYDDFEGTFYMRKNDDMWERTMDIRQATGYQYKEWAESAITEISAQGIYKDFHILKVEYTIKVEKV